MNAVSGIKRLRIAVPVICIIAAASCRTMPSGPGSTHRVVYDDPDAWAERLVPTVVLGEVTGASVDIDDRMVNEAQSVLISLLEIANASPPKRREGEPITVELSVILRQRRFIQRFRERFSTTVELELRELNGSVVGRAVRTRVGDTGFTSYRFLLKELERGLELMLSRRLR